MTQEEFQHQVLKRFKQIDARFDALDGKSDCLREELNGKFASLTLNLIRSGVSTRVHPAPSGGDPA